MYSYIVSDRGSLVGKREVIVMAKSIKFNLISDNVPIRTIDDLRNNFSIEDVLSYYKNGLLKRWLDVRGYNDELKKVKEIKSDDSVEILEKLIEIFKVETDKEIIKKNLYILKYNEEKKMLLDEYHERKTKKESIINDFCSGYDELVDSLLDSAGDISKIKAIITELSDEYLWVLGLAHRNLFYKMYEKSYLIVLCALMNEKFRNYYLPNVIKMEDGTERRDIDSNSPSYDDDKFRVYQKIRKICDQIYGNKSADDDSWENQIGGFIKTFSGETDGYWKDIEPAGKKYMVIMMGNGDYVRSAGDNGGDLNYTDVNYNFKILDGIDYKSNSASRVFYYMEV